MTPLMVHPWPGPVPAPEDGLVVIAIETTAGAPRAQARAQIRLAAKEALSALLSLPVGSIDIESTPGQPPRIVLPAGDARTVGCSFAHEDGHSVAAINLRGAVGIDLMRVQDIPDWQVVSRDYLGLETTAMLLATHAAERPRAFAQAWAKNEAVLKCHGEQLSEWTDGEFKSTPRLCFLSEAVVICLAHLNPKWRKDADAGGDSGPAP
jgi:4'-phosphopantetheinyl transferase